MLISKFYKQATSSSTAASPTASLSSNLGTGTGTGNNKQTANRTTLRVITPSSIPIFVLPPTLENFNANTSKRELNDSCDCLNIKLAEDDTNTAANGVAAAISTQSINNRHANEPPFTTYRKPGSLDISNTNKNKNNNNNYTNKLFKNNSFRIEKTPPDSATPADMSGSLYNINRQQQSNHLKPSFKKKTFNSFNTTSQSPTNGQSPAQTPNQSHSVVKAFIDLHHHHHSQSQQNEEEEREGEEGDDEYDLKAKENYCNSWVMNTSGAAAALNRNSLDGTFSISDGGRHSINGSIKSNVSTSTCSSYMLRLQNEITLNETNHLIAVRKQASNYTIASQSHQQQQAQSPPPPPQPPQFKSHMDQDYLNKAKEEEKLQREYLVNLLKQLESEQSTDTTANNASATAAAAQHASMDDTKRTIYSRKQKKTKRSKSETFIEMNAIRLVPLNNGKTAQIKSEKQNSTLESSRQQNKTTVHNQLEPNDAAAASELSRFSLRNLFKLNAKSTQNMSSATHATASKLSSPDATTNSYSQFSMSSLSLDDKTNNIMNQQNKQQQQQQQAYTPTSLISGSGNHHHHHHQNQLSVLDLTSRVERLSNTNLNQMMNPLVAYHPLTAGNNSDAGSTGTGGIGGSTSLLTIKRQSFKLSKKMNNQRRSVVNDLSLESEVENEDLNYNDDVEKAFNEFYTKHKIDVSNTNHGDEDGSGGATTDHLLTKAKPRLSLFSKIFCSHRVTKSKQIVLNHFGGGGDDRDFLNDQSKHNINNLNLNSIENEFKRNSVKEIIYMKLNKSLFNKVTNANHTPTISNYASVDVIIERLQQSAKNMHILTLNVKNLRVEPLFEINHVKARLAYYYVSLVDVDEVNEQVSSSGKKGKARGPSISINNNNPLLSSLAAASASCQQKNFIKIHRIKNIKCKFNAANKHLQKQVEFELAEDHFLNVTEDATNIITKQAASKQKQAAALEMAYFFLFSIELHSYLPVSRMKLSSTFSKKKKIYRGQTQINENFVINTQFCKKFELTEV